MNTLIRLIAVLLEILQVPISMGMLPMPVINSYSQIKSELKLFGWITADQFYDAIYKYMKESFVPMA